MEKEISNEKRKSKMFLKVKKLTIYNLRLVVFIGEGYAAWFAFYALCGVFLSFYFGLFKLSPCIL